MEWTILAKYFVHGIAFSLLSIVLAFAMVVLFVFLAVIGSFIGVISGLAVLLLAVGGLNSFLTDAIWGTHTQTSLSSLFLHGLTFFLLLLVVNGLLVMVPNVAFPSTATTIITFISGAFAGGYVGKTVAGWFESEFQREEIPQEVQAQWTDTKL